MPHISPISPIKRAVQRRVRSKATPASFGGDVVRRILTPPTRARSATRRVITPPGTRSRPVRQPLGGVIRRATRPIAPIKSNRRVRKTPSPAVIAKVRGVRSQISQLRSRG